MKTYMMKSNPSQRVQAIRLTKDNVEEVEHVTKGVAVLEHDALDPTKEFVHVNFPTRGGRKILLEREYYTVAGGVVEIVPAVIFEDMYVEISDAGK